MDETLSELRKNGPSNEDKAACNSPATPDAHPGRTRFIRKVLNGVAAALGIGTGLAATACNTPKPPVIEREATAVLPTPTEQLVPCDPSAFAKDFVKETPVATGGFGTPSPDTAEMMRIREKIASCQPLTPEEEKAVREFNLAHPPLPQKTEVPPSPSPVPPTPDPDPTETPEPTPTRIVRNNDLGASRLEGGSSPRWDQKSRNWREIREEIGDRFLPTSAVDPTDSENKPVQMEIQFLTDKYGSDPQKVTGIAYVYPHLSEGTKVRAVGPGLVERISDMSDTETRQIVGHQISIRYSSSIIIIYPYIHGKEPLLVQKGDTVKQGQVIGNIGSSELPHIMPWSLSVTFTPPTSLENRNDYLTNYKAYWLSWPPVTAKDDN